MDRWRKKVGRAKDTAMKYEEGGVDVARLQRQEGRGRRTRGWRGEERGERKVMIKSGR